ncbi:hypothetical protein HYC85_023912 [Camellia sinensis]|uniref:Pentatricopeptide repeat-containing protein n=1 Tax=Camellia sinensis TaxID=4442 RepID=A0A7J7GFV0_CAMSI|nr:hypothetical protein HYC85_023912 [Camellia sinensis]
MSPPEHRYMDVVPYQGPIVLLRSSGSLAVNRLQPFPCTTSDVRMHSLGLLHVHYIIKTKALPLDLSTSPDIGPIGLLSFILISHNFDITAPNLNNTTIISTTMTRPRGTLAEISEPPRPRGVIHKILPHNLDAHLLKLDFNSHIYVTTSLFNAYVVASFPDACDLFDEMLERNMVTWNTMITGYSKSGDIEKAWGVFDRMPLKDVPSWSAMIACYVNNGHKGNELALFLEILVVEQLKPDQVTLGSILVGIAAWEINSRTYCEEWLGIECGTWHSFVDMYAKCVFLKNASRVFDMMPDRNVQSWTVLICGFA